MDLHLDCFVDDGRMPSSMFPGCINSNVHLTKQVALLVGDERYSYFKQSARLYNAHPSQHPSLMAGPTSNPNLQTMKPLTPKDTLCNLNDLPIEESGLEQLSSFFRRFGSLQSMILTRHRAG
mmetsp:Transcript_8767/g.13910  ORF Transcript_8767/g.13910 Transcript_8767/m.13910 type:complete len:122 (-) Transcript_8767:663-1028(-)